MTIGNKMTNGHHQQGREETPQYRSMHKAIETGSPVCQGVPGSAIDPAIGQFLFDTVTPLSLEVALKV